MPHVYLKHGRKRLIFCRSPLAMADPGHVRRRRLGRSAQTSRCVRERHIGEMEGRKRVLILVLAQGLLCSDAGVYTTSLGWLHSEMSRPPSPDPDPILNCEDQPKRSSLCYSESKKDAATKGKDGPGSKSEGRYERSNLPRSDEGEGKEEEDLADAGLQLCRTESNFKGNKKQSQSVQQHGKRKKKD